MIKELYKMNGSRLADFLNELREMLLVDHHHACHEVVVLDLDLQGFSYLIEPTPC
jgi:hypothetical protein